MLENINLTDLSWTTVCDNDTHKLDVGNSATGTEPVPYLWDDYPSEAHDYN